MPASMTTVAASSRVSVSAARPASVAAPLRLTKASSSSASSRRSASASSSSSRLNGAAVANASAKTLAVDKLRSDEDKEELGEFFEKRKWKGNKREREGG